MHVLVLILTLSYYSIEVPVLHNSDADTLVVVQTGKSNQIITDTLQSDSSNISSTLYKGIIHQTGDQNQVELDQHSAGKKAGESNNINIKQTGRNNSVKIKTH